MKRGFLLFVPLLFLTFACAAIPNFLAPTPAATIILKPVDSTKADSASLEQTRQIIQERLEYAGIKNKVSLGDQANISVEIYSSADLDTAQKLSTETGAFAFVDSVDGYPEGYKLEDISAPILTQSDIQSAIPQKGAAGGYEIDVLFTAEGAKKIADYSGKHIGHFLLVVKDGIVLMAPKVTGAITAGSAVIQGKFDLTTANLLAVQLRTRSLPLTLQVDQIKQPATK